MEREEIVEKFAEFLKEYYYNDLVSAASEGKKSLLIDFSILDKFNPELADFLLENPEEVLAAAEDSLKQIDLPGSVKLRIRVFNLPEEKQIRIRNIRAEHIGKLISVDGMVKRASEIRPEVSEAIFQCPECGAKITVIQTERFIRPPTECECGNRKNFKFVDQKLYDARWITIEEPFEITSGERPSEIMVFLKEDLTSPKMQNKTDPGNRIKVVGILKQIPRRVKGTRSRQLEIYIDANSIESVEVEWEELEITPEDEKKILELAKDPEIYSKLVASIAPSLYGLDEIKEAIALQLFGGETHVQKDKSRVRGEIHILLVGDPSTAKSALMKVVAGLIPRGRYVSGKGVSVDYDDPVIYMENGIIKTGLIGNVIDRFYKKDEEGFVKVSGISVPSFNPITMKIEWSPVRYVFRHRIKEKMIKMILETGREVKVTSDHSVFVLENGIMTKKADEIKEGDFVVIPKIIPPNPNPITEIDFKKELEKIPKNERKYIKIVDKKYLKSKFSPHKIPIKIKVDDKLMRLLGYYIADGWLHETKGNSWKIEFEINASDKKTIQDLQKIVHTIFKIKVNVKKRRDSNSCRISVDDKIVFLIFKYILRVGMNAETKKIPEIIFNVSPKLQKEFIKAFVKGDYGVTISKMLMSDLLYLFTLNGVIASFGKRKKEGMIKFPGGRTSYVNGYVFELKSPKPIKILSKMLNNSGLHSRVPIKLVEGLGIDLSKSGYSRISPSAYRFIFSKNRKMLYERLKVMENGIDAKSLSKIIKRNLKSTQQYLNSLVKKGLVEKYKVNGKNAYKLTVIGKRLISKLDLIQKLKDSHLGFVRVKKIEIENPTNKYVYDFSVDGKENFIAGFGGVCCHNTGAGLTATVVRDEEFLGGWVLEAGALVMCNRSLICLCPGTRIIVNGKIVEIDKLFDSLKFEKVKCGSNLIDVGNIKGIVPSFDLSSLKTDLHNSKFIGRRKYSGEILNLRFKSGFSLRLTPEHELLDGNKLIWKKAKDFSKGDLVVAPLKLPSIKNDIYIFDLIPGDWKVCLEKNEKKLIKEKILEKYKSIAEFNKKFGINKRVFSGGNQLSLKKFKEIATDLGILEEWRKKPLKYGRINSSKKIKIIKVTPELGYILGFIFGDGYLVRKVGHGGISVNQSIKHEKYIKAFVRCWEKVFGEKPHVREFKTISNLNGRRIESIGKNIYYGSNLLVILYDALVGKSLENILSLPDNILKAFIAGAFDSDGCISIKKKKKYRVAHVEFLLSDEENVNLNFMLALRRFDIYSRLVKSKNKVSIIRITGRKDVINLKNAIKNYSEKIKIEIPKRINKVSSFSDKLPRFIVAEICEEIINQINTSILNKLGISSIVYDYKKLKYQPSRDQLLKIIRKCGPFLNDETKEKIQKMVKRDFLLDEIIEIKRENYDGFVYDLYVPETNNFVANGVFVHNCIDEFEKIEKTDQIALHEAMEQNTISIAKASIVATLPAQTSILAGGNPKLGRFDPYIPIKEQIDVPETLLSRFDLKFALRDIPNPELDAKVAEHILKSRHYGEEEIKPAIEADLLKKYVAYARKNCHPKLSKEAGEEIKNFFLSLREKVGVEEAAVPITLRQYEALIRLAEASAKVQLRDTVTREDAIRAINLMKASLREFGFEAETGRFDVDRLEGRITASERGKIRTVLDIIEELTKTVGNIIPKEDVIKAAKDKGIKEFDVEKILNELKNKGDIFEPKVGFLQKM